MQREAPIVWDVFLEMGETVVDGWWDLAEIMRGQWWRALWVVCAAASIQASVCIVRRAPSPWLATRAVPTAFGVANACRAGQYLSGDGVCAEPAGVLNIANGGTGISSTTRGIVLEGTGSVPGDGTCKVLRWNGSYMECAPK
jgi:hypothetical protein